MYNGSGLGVVVASFSCPQSFFIFQSLLCQYMNLIHRQNTIKHFYIIQKAVKGIAFITYILQRKKQGLHFSYGFTIGKYIPITFQLFC